MQQRVVYAALQEVAGRTLSGPLITYAETARWGGIRERVQPGALDVRPGLLLTRQHDRAIPLARLGAGLELSDGPEAMRVRAVLPATPAADAVLADVRAGLLTGLSAEYTPTAERMEGDVRVVTAARLTGLSVVDDPAFAGSRLVLNAAGDDDPPPDPPAPDPRRRRGRWL